MITLPIDLQHMIADYIVTYEDLKALCVASKYFHSYVVPRLYERIHLRLWDREHTDRFMESVAAGAGDKFRFTRTLVLEDIPMVAEPICDLTELRYLSECDWDEHRRGIDMTEEERESRMSECLRLFPEHCLRRFCTAHLAHYLQHPHVFSENIHELSFIYGPEDERDGSVLPDEFEVTKTLPNLKKVTLAGMDIRYAYRVGRGLIDSLDISTLTHLSMLECQGGNTFATGLGLIACKTEIDLEHIALDLGWLAEDKEGSVEIYLGDLLAAGRHIKSLHLKWYCSTLGEALVDRICAIGPRLESLSLQEGMDMYSVSPLNSRDLATIFKACPNLRQFGYQFGDEAYTNKDIDESIEDFVEAAKHLKELQMVHIRLSPYCTVGFASDEGQPEPNLILTQIQGAANNAEDAAVYGYTGYGSWFGWVGSLGVAGHVLGKHVQVTRTSESCSHPKTLWMPRQLNLTRKSDW
ncbi:hypothetical protein HBI04_193630 [Parastagonospora nodorum]|nr:hypothetical protein HBI03_202050 [Parastagonospora nodorum]KAH4263370.1 hypothetical protein HBI04_193630 [Parastagonospora nodorum]KAH5068641.1 hypothetical protein HBH95_190240 [Parastagonospora nodorum]KAH5337497.1 hypothetical protein HBI50_022750 [Parastagonospora nodorum]KAH5397835.1 hypothetical protein HBI32_192510 [Parastagonospora nodorum]